MSDNKWDDKLIEKFLILYKRHKCLWNPYTSNYKNCSAKNEAFETVVRELNVPGIRMAECLQQIKVVRERYREEQARIKRKLKSGKLCDSKVPWFDLMSQMLYEVIRDEEKFDKNVESRSQVSNYVRDPKGKQNGYDAGTYKPARGESHPSCLTNKFEKSVFGSSRCEINNSRYTATVKSKVDVENSAGLKKRSVEIDEANCNQCDKCSLSGCSWENKGREEEEKSFGGKKLRFVSCEERGVQIEPEIESGNSIDQSSSPSNPCSDDQRTTDCLCRKIIQPAIESADVTRSGKGKTVRGECERNPTEEKENEMIKGSCVHREKETYKPPAEPGSESTESTMNKTCCYDSRIKHSSKDNISKFSAEEKDQERYDVCSRFKIVIPGPASDDQNLEITKYEVRLIDPRLWPNVYPPQYNQNSGKQINSSDSYCVCSRKELSSPEKRNAYDVQDVAAFDGNIIKLDINCKHSEDMQRRRSTNERRVNKKTQTKGCCGSEMMRREEAKLNSSVVSVRDQESGNDDPPLTNRTTRYSASLIKDVDESRERNRATGNAACCTEEKKSRKELSKSFAPEEEGEKFINTKMVLNVIVKILEGDGTRDQIPSQELERTLNTMLDTFNQKMNNAVEVQGNEISGKYTPFASSFEETQYTDLPPMIQQRRNKEFADTSRITEPTSFRPQSTGMVIFDDQSDDRFGEFSEQSETPIVQKFELKKEPTVDEDTIIASSGPRVAEAPNRAMKMPRFSSDPTLNNTVSEFESEEPVASSSRKTIAEPRPANQLAKDFLDIIKHTIMMDQALENSVNNGNDCCNKLENQSTNSRNPYNRRY